MTTPPPSPPEPAATRPATPADPRWVPGLPFTARLRPTGEFAFDAPPADTLTLLELTPEDLGRRFAARDLPFADPAEGPAFWASLAESAAALTPWRREVRVVGAESGREIWARIHAVPRADPGGGVVWAGLLVDVTDLKVAEQERRAADQQLATHFDNTPLAVIEWDAEFRVRRWSGRAEQVFGWAAAEVVGRSALDFALIHPDDAAAVSELMRDILTRRQPRSRRVNRNMTKAGRTLVCEWYNSVLTDDAGALASILSLTLDVTERHEAAEALARSEERLRTALHATRMVVWERDLMTGRIEASDDLAAFFGLPPDSDPTSDATARAAVHPDDLPRVRDEHVRLIATGEDVQHEYRGGVPAEDGGVRWYSTRAILVRDGGGAPLRVIAVSADITARKRAEREKETFDRQLREAQKLESLGVLAGGLAHDFNNLLTVILGNAGLTRRLVPDGSAAHGYLDHVDAACHRAANLCRQMLAYAGRGQVVIDRVDLNRVVRDSSALFGVSAASRVRVDFLPAERLPAVAADLTQVRQVVVNLVLNATEAIGDRDGVVYVRTGVATLTGREGGPPEADHCPPPPPGRYVYLDVADTGPGMPADVRARIFEPFFTTKFAGRGLGLPAVLGIVRAHGGTVRVDTAVGRGTRVRVLWPAAEAKESTKSPPTVSALPPRQPSPSPGGRVTGTALVVDDEMYVREVAASVLEEIGFEPLVADGGEAALAMFAAHRDALRVAVIDVLMPDMGGGEVLARIRAIDPAFPVILVSGYPDRGLAGLTPDGGRTLFLQKPFHPEELANAVQAVLGAP